MNTSDYAHTLRSPCVSRLLIKLSIPDSLYGSTSCAPPKQCTRSINPTSYRPCTRQRLTHHTQNTNDYAIALGSVSLSQRLLSSESANLDVQPSPATQPEYILHVGVITQTQHRSNTSSFHIYAIFATQFLHHDGIDNDEQHIESPIARTELMPMRWEQTHPLITEASQRPRNYNAVDTHLINSQHNESDSRTTPSNLSQTKQ